MNFDDVTAKTPSERERMLLRAERRFTTLPVTPPQGRRAARAV
ncbi:hypothetical protein ACTD5D_18590 [Nocardia takedensis]|nr:hypothetical protein [Nocardia takedensis]